MFRAFSYRLWKRSLAVFWGKNVFFHLAAIALTYVLVVSDTDWHFFEATRSPYLYGIVLAAGLGGFLVPVALPLGMYIVGEVKKNASLSFVGATSGQAVIIAWLISAFYKVFTGRIQPEVFTQGGSLDISHGFHFGILQNGIFWGWPSSHATVACALAACLCVLYTRTSVRYLAILFAVIVSLGAGIGFHWLSDVLAGAIIGSLVGVVVARDALQAGRAK